MENKSIYITVRLDVESNQEITEDMVQEIVSELDYSFKSQTDEVNITNTEICGINE